MRSAALLLAVVLRERYYNLHRADVELHRYMPVSKNSRVIRTGISGQRSRMRAVAWRPSIWRHS
jgi:hypothetical protein